HLLVERRKGVGRHPPQDHLAAGVRSEEGACRLHRREPEGRGTSLERQRGDEPGEAPLHDPGLAPGRRRGQLERGGRSEGGDQRGRSTREAVGGPVGHRDDAARPRDPEELVRDHLRSRGEHGAERRHHDVEPLVLERQVLRIRLVPLDVQTLRGRALPAPRDHLRREGGRDHGRPHPRRGDRDVSGPGRDVEHRRARPDVAGLRERDRLGEDRLRDRAIVAEPPHRRGAPLQLIETHRPASSPSGVASLAPTALARHRQGGQRSASNLVPSVTPARDQDVLLSAVPDRGRPEPPLARRLGVEMGAWREDRRAGGERVGDRRESVGGAVSRPPRWREVFRGARGRLTAGLLLLEALVAIQILVVATVMPAVRRDLGDIQFYGWTFSAAGLGQFAAIPIAGRAMDRFGSRRLLAATLALYTTGLLLAAFAPSMLALVGARLIQGIGGGSTYAVSLGTVAKTYPEDVRPRVLALLAAMWILPGLLGPPLGAALAATLGWRWAFVAPIPVLALSAVLVFPALPAGLGDRGARISLGPPLVLAAGAGAFLAGLTDLSVWSIPLVVVGLAVALPAL